MIGLGLVPLLAGHARAGTFFGALSNFDAVNDTGSTCNGFEIELDDIHSQDVTYTFSFQRYGVPKITEDTYLDASNVSHPRTFVRWMSPYDQVNHVFTQRTLPAAPGFANTGGHLCFGTNVVNGSPYDLSGCEHFGLGTLKNPSNTVYRWMQESTTTPGSLVALGNPVTIPAPVWTVPAGPNPVVAAVIPVPPPPAVVPVPYQPNAEFGVAVWAKVFESESPSKADLDHLTSDDPSVPGNEGSGGQPPNTVTEIEWQILQTDSMNPTANELKSERPLGAGNESVTRRYEFYKYVGQYDVGPPGGEPGTNEALCPNVAADGKHGTASATGGLDCSGMIVVGDYIGAQNAAADVGLPLSANGADLSHGEVGVHYPDRPLIFGGSGGPYSIGFTGGTLPATDPGNEFTLDAITGILHGGTPNGTGTASFTVHATDLGDATQTPVDTTFNIMIVPAVTVDDIVIPNGTANVQKDVNLTASGGESPFTWSIMSHSPTLQASIVGNTLSLDAPADGLFSVEVAVADSLGGTSSRSLSYNVGGVVAACGNGTPDPGEQCDDGAANGTLASCCTADCHLKADSTVCTDDGNPCTKDVCDGVHSACEHPAGNVGTICRPSEGVCDVAETCDGVHPVCPDNAFKPSTEVCGTTTDPCEAAATCSGSDAACPPNTKRPDSDGDGACDAIDVCTNVGGGQNFRGASPKPLLAVGNVNTNTVAGNDTFKLTGAFVLGGTPPFSAVDPGTHGARVVVENGAGAVRIDAGLLPGMYAGSKSRGWKLSRNGKTWTYLDTTGAPIAGVAHLTIIDKSQPGSKHAVPGLVQVKGSGSKATYPVVAGDEPLKGIVVLGGQAQSEAGACGETAFVAGNCVFNRKGNLVTCKP